LTVFTVLNIIQLVESGFGFINVCISFYRSWLSLSWLAVTKGLTNQN